MSWRSGLTIVGQAVGTYFGGPVGGAVGGAVGGYIGGQIDGPMEFEGTRLSDLRLSTSTYGLTLPLVYGPNNRISGNMIWTTGLIEHSVTEDAGGKGGTESEYTTYFYSASVAMAMCSGAKDPSSEGMKTIYKIWCNSKLLVNCYESCVNFIANLEEAINLKQQKIDSINDQIDDENLSPDEIKQLQDWIDIFQNDINEIQAVVDDLYITKSSMENGDPLGWTLRCRVTVSDLDLSCAAADSISFYPGSFSQLPDPVIEADKGSGNTSAYRGTCYVVIEGLALADYGNTLPSIEVEIKAKEEDSARGITQDICYRSGLDQGEFSASGIKDFDVSGFVISKQMASLSAIAPLATANAFDVVEQGGVIRFLSRGRAPVATINDYEMAARDSGQEAEEVINISRAAEFDMPKEATLTYRDKERNYLENTQIASRKLGNTNNNINQELPMVLDNNRARKIVDRLLWESWVGRISATFNINDKWAFLRPADVITIKVAGVMTPFRIDKFLRGVNGVIECVATMEDPYIYEGYEVGSVAEIPANEVRFTGPTFAYVFNAPILYPTDLERSFTWAIDAEESGWRSGSLKRSLDDIDFALVGSSSVRNKTGIVAGVLDSANAEFWDRTTVITVTLNYPEHELESRSEDLILDGYNSCWIGAPDGSQGEIIQFATATLINNNPRVYELTNLLRGRRGTEHYINNHVANEVFVLLQSQKNYNADFGVPDWDVVRYYKGVSSYQSSYGSADSQQFINTGEKSRPRSPVHAEAERDSSGNVYFSWVRRVRGLAAVLGYGPVALDEATESYEVDVYNVDTVVRTITSSAPYCEYTEAQQVEDGLTPGDDVKIKIYQISATRGRGHAGEFTL